MLKIFLFLGVWCLFCVFAAREKKKQQKKVYLAAIVRDQEQKEFEEKRMESSDEYAAYLSDTSFLQDGPSPGKYQYGETAAALAMISPKLKPTSANTGGNGYSNYSRKVTIANPEDYFSDLEGAGAGTPPQQKEEESLSDYTKRLEFLLTRNSTGPAKLKPLQGSSSPAASILNYAKSTVAVAANGGPDVGVLGQSQRINRAVLVVKPHCAALNALYLIIEMMDRLHVRIINQEKFLGNEVEWRKIVERKFCHVRRYASEVIPREIEFSQKEQKMFTKKFGEHWRTAVDTGLVVNSTEACEIWDIDEDALSTLWLAAAAQPTQQLRVRQGLTIVCIDASCIAQVRKNAEDATAAATVLTTSPSPRPVSASGSRKDLFARSRKSAKEMGKMSNVVDVDDDEGAAEKSVAEVRFKSYTAALQEEQAEDKFYQELEKKLAERPLLVINGFYESMRADYCAETAELTYMNIEWDEDVVSWKYMLSKVVGDSDPSLAEVGSIRGQLYKNYKLNGLSVQPTRMDNCVHISRSAFEGLADRMIFVKNASIFEDPFGARLLSSQVPVQAVYQWLYNPFINDKSVFDHFKGMDSDASIRKAHELLGKVFFFVTFIFLFYYTSYFYHFFCIIVSF